MTARIEHGDCRELLRTLPDASVDAVVTDPPYPCIKRAYGTLTETEWHALMSNVCGELRRVLKPSGSAVIVLQPNMEKLGRTRPWLFDFVTRQCHEWNVIQDAYWWNITAMPGIGGNLLRPSVKFCVWLGDPEAYRDRSTILWSETDANKAHRAHERAFKISPSGHVTSNTTAAAAIRNGGVTPFNVIPTGNVNRPNGGHPASTPLPLCQWWVRYISPPGGLVLDPFAGSGTTGVACANEGRDFIGFEQRAEYVEIARTRLGI